jgi:hypothetical protein
LVLYVSFPTFSFFGVMDPSDSVVVGPVGRWRMCDGVVVERVGDEVLALVGDRVVQVDGVVAEVLSAVADGVVVSDDVGVVEALEVLAGLGVVTCDRWGVSRRRALALAAGGVSLGATVLVLPSSVAAASEVVEGSGGVGGGGDPPPAPSAPSNVTFSNATDDGFTVSWDPVSDEGGA